MYSYFFPTKFALRIVDYSLRTEVFVIFETINDKTPLNPPHQQMTNLLDIDHLHLNIVLILFWNLDT